MTESMNCWGGDNFNCRISKYLFKLAAINSSKRTRPDHQCPPL